MNNLSVSVIIPTYNAARTLRRAISSVIAQTSQPKEIIVVDDGSTDDTPLMAPTFCRASVIYVRQSNSGPAAARNRGLAMAQGDCIAFLDADDYWRPKFLERCVEFLFLHPEAIAVSTGLFINKLRRPPVTLPVFRESSSLRRREGYLIDDFFSFWAHNDHIRTGSCLIRRSIIEQAGFQRTDLRAAEDLEYWGYLATFGKWGFLPEALWVGDSEASGAMDGWIKRYAVRRQLCPTVEQWQQRMMLRLKECEIAGFKRMRWRIAVTIAQDLILSGRWKAAKNIIQTYREAAPHSILSDLLQFGNRAGPLVWPAICILVIAREYQKAAVMSFLARRLQHHAPSI